MTTFYVDVIGPPPPAVIEVDTVLAQGPPGPAGADGADGAPGPPGPSGADVPHHVNHETGGADALAAVSAAVLTTGTLPNARLAPDVAVTGSVAVGTNPAQSGAIRLANNQFIVGRNAANTDDVIALMVDPTNHVRLGSYWQFNMIENGHLLPVDIYRDIGTTAKRVRSLYLSQSLQLGELPFASLPAATVGALANVSDSTTATIGGTVAGGGTNHILARYNGTAWKVIGG
jgi:hypothetical protein